MNKTYILCTKSPKRFKYADNFDGPFSFVLVWSWWSSSPSVLEVCCLRDLRVLSVLLLVVDTAEDSAEEGEVAEEEDGEVCE